MKVILTTPRLTLRLMEASDERALEALDSDPAVRAFFPGGTSSRPASRQRIEDSRTSYATYGYSDFIVEDGSSGEMLGRAGLHRMPDGEVEAGYVLFERFWGRGIATEVLGALLDWFDPSLSPSGRVIAMAPSNHRASLRVMEKCGMTFFKAALHQGVECRFYERRLR